MVGNVANISLPVFTVRSNANGEGLSEGRAWMGRRAGLSHVPSNSVGTPTECKPAPKVNNLVSWLLGHAVFPLNQSASVWSSSFKAKLIPEDRILAESPEPVDWSSGMLGRRANLEGRVACSVWSSHTSGSGFDHSR